MYVVKFQSQFKDTVDHVCGKLDERCGFIAFRIQTKIQFHECTMVILALVGLNLAAACILMYVS